MTTKKHLTKELLEKLKKKALEKEKRDITLNTMSAEDFLTKRTKQNFLPK